MSLRDLPAVHAFQRRSDMDWRPPSTDALEQWSAGARAAEADDPNTIAIFDVIGDDPWSDGGFTAKRMAGALRAIGKNDVTVELNSPGGDMFEGVTIYNLLREHPAKVTVKVMGIAASAASIIAMAGDDIVMGVGTTMMIHNAWGIVVGNKTDMREAADIFGQFDQSMVDIYAARTAVKPASIVTMMDAETYMTARMAVEKGFADSVSDSLSGAAKARVVDDPPKLMAKREIDFRLASQGVPRSRRREIVKALSDTSDGMHDAADTATHDAGLDLAAVRQLIDTLRS